MWWMVKYDKCPPCTRGIGESAGWRVSLDRGASKDCLGPLFEGRRANAGLKAAEGARGWRDKQALVATCICRLITCAKKGIL